MTSRRTVRVDQAFFDDLDRQLGSDRGPNGDPSSTDFIVIDLPTVVEVPDRRRGAELERQDALDETSRYLEELVAEVGKPSTRQQSQADAIARRIRDRSLDRVS